MRSFSVVDKKYPYYVRNNTLYLCIGGSVIFTTHHPHFNLSQTPQKIRMNSAGRASAMPTKRSAVVTALNLLGANLYG